MLATDYSHVIEALRTKARDSAVTVEEAAALNDKANELERKHLKPTIATPEFHVTHVHEPPKTTVHVQWSFRSQQGEWVTKSLDFPDDWYETADEWWNWDSGSMAE